MVRVRVFGIGLVFRVKDLGVRVWPSRLTSAIALNLEHSLVL